MQDASCIMQNAKCKMQSHELGYGLFMAARNKKVDDVEFVLCNRFICARRVKVSILFSFQQTTEKREMARCRWCGDTNPSHRCSIGPGSSKVTVQVKSEPDDMLKSLNMLKHDLAMLEAIMEAKEGSLNLAQRQLVALQNENQGLRDSVALCKLEHVSTPSDFSA